MKKRETKERFFRELKNELTKYFPIHDVREIVDDYKMFFNEKETNKLGVKEIIVELGEPYEIVQELVKDKVDGVNIIQKILSREKVKKLLIGIWVILTLVFIAIIEWSYMIPATGFVLALLQIGLFWYIFVYKRFLLGEEESVRRNNALHINLLALIPIVMVYYNLFLLRVFSDDWSKMPLLNNMSVSEIGPFIHYQILFTLIICFVFLYIMMLKSTNALIQLNSIFLFQTSIIILISLHAQLGNLSSMSTFHYYLSNQLVMYTVVIFVFGIAQLFIYKKYKGVLK